MKTYLKLIILILLFVLSTFINITFSKIYIDKKIELQEIYVASHNISSRHLLKEEDINVIKIPKIFVNEDVYTFKDEILGKYTDIQGKIPKGSPFYKNMLFDKASLVDSPHLQLKTNQTSFTIAADILSLSGNTLISGQRVNLHGSLLTNQNVLIEDLLVENSRIISINDNKGYNLEHPSSNKIPYSITFAIDNSSLEYLTVISKIGKIDIYANSNSYDSSNESKLYKNSKIVEYINDLYKK
ncbi:MAG: SAF domain-containing protein [Erysipelotrichaceae bacterium]|nr:SAF domain-containing protein [Erysipelotrichaceae bacterium]